MNIFLSEKPVGVQVVDFTGEPGFERPSEVRYTYSLDIEPDEIWMLCWRLPSTLRQVPSALQVGVEIEGKLLSFTCPIDAHERNVKDIGEWIIEANKQKDDLLSTRESQSDASKKRQTVLDKLTNELAVDLGIGGSDGEYDGGSQDATRIEDW